MKHQDIKKNWLENEYVINGLSIANIAKSVNCTPRTIRKKLEYFEIPIKKGGEHWLKKHIGFVSGRLTVLEKRDRQRWLCRCQCGNEVEVTTYHLNKWKSCGCVANKSGEKSARYKGYKSLTGSMVSSIVKGAVTRKLEFDREVLTPKYLYELLEAQNWLCALSGCSVSFKDKTASLDRIDSSIGYTKDNIQWVHKDINQMKWKFTQDHFIEMCSKVYKSHYNGV